MASTSKRIKPRIKPRKIGNVPSVDEIWIKLTRNIREIQNHRAFTLSFEENYRLAYQMVVNKNGETLYNGVLALITENLERLANEIIYPAFPSTVDDDPVTESQEYEKLLKALTKVWEDHTSSTQKLSHILKYMDRVHTKAANVPEVIEAGRNLFLKHIIRPPINDHIISAILGLLRIERDGYVINRSAATGCVDVLLQLSRNNDTVTVYKEDLEPVILKTTEEYYRAEGERLLETCDAPECLRRIDSRFSEEQSRAHQYLSLKTAEPLRQILQDTLLTPHLRHIIGMAGSGLDVMIDSERIDDLSRLYRLFVTVPTGLSTLRRSIKDSVVRRGKGIDNESPLDEMDDGGEGGDEPDAATGKGKSKARPTSGSQSLALALRWVEDVLRLKDKFDGIWKGCFKSDREIESGLNEAFESFINLQPRAPEFVSLFIDENLKKGLKGKTDIEVEAILEKTITVFRYITEKDVFERYYKGHLAKRLLLGRSVSDDAERGMLAKLKVECGFQFTQKLEGMFHDMKISGETMQAYRTHLARLDAVPDVDINVTVMTSTFWPMSYTSIPCVLPPELVATSKAFEQFYLSRHSGRRLTWQPSMGNVDVRVAFKARKHDLNVSTFALVVLLLFDRLGEGEFLTYKEIKDATLIPDQDLQRNLQSLACAKFKVLKKHPPGRDVNLDDSFSFNNDFSSPLQKIKISTVASKVESGEERKETQDRVDEERRHQTEACIVRIMKDRKHMTHNDLINEVTRQLAMRFQPNPLNIKKRIEGLIEREYLERCADRKSYNYLA